MDIELEENSRGDANESETYIYVTKYIGMI